MAFSPTLASDWLYGNESGPISSVVISSCRDFRDPSRKAIPLELPDLFDFLGAY
ncbi:MAG: hypothetical protein QOJ42_654 [Acidobacteriaceae bacterium]|nr:hypothetical protein [Acidobacteriaceae bacterium]